MRSLTERMKILRNTFSQKHNFFKNKKGKWKKEANMLPIPRSPIIYKAEKQESNGNRELNWFCLFYYLVLTTLILALKIFLNTADAILIFKYHVRKVCNSLLSKYRCFSFNSLTEVRGRFFFLFYSCQSNILFVSTSNSFCNKGFQNPLSFLWGNNKGWNKQGRWLYIILSFQILVPSCYEVHARILFYCASDTDKMKEALIPYKE